MATQTTHYSLIKPDYEDQADVGVLNGDLDQIDELIYNANNDVRTVSKGGTGATTAEEARENLGLGDVLNDVSELQNALGNVAFIRKNASPSNKNATFTFPGYSVGFLFVCGGNASQRGIWCINVASNGNVSYTKMDSTSSSNIALSDSTYSLNVTNNYASATAIIGYMCIYGNLPT